MDTTNGLPRHAPGRAPEPLGSETPALRLALGGYGVTELSEPMARLVGRPASELLGRPVDGLWAPAERAAIRARLDDVVVYGDDRIAALALARPGADPLWVVVEARYDWRGGERLELAFRPLEDVPSAEERVAAARRREAEAAVSEGTEGGANGTHSEHVGRVAPDVAPGGGPPAEGDVQGASDAAALDAGNGDTRESGAGEGADAAPAGPEARRVAPAAAVGTSSLEPPSAAATLDEALALAGAVGLALLAVGAGRRVVGATAAARRWVGDEAVGRSLEATLGLEAAAREALELARRDGRRLTLHAHARHADEDLRAEWLPGARPEGGWLRLTAIEDTDASTTRLLQAEWLAHLVGHDARGRLSEVEAGLDTLSEELPDRLGAEDPLLVTLEHTRKACAAALEVVADVHEATERDADNRRDLDLGGLLAEVLERYAPRAAARGVALRDALATNLVVHGDRAQLRRAFANLVDNALRAMPGGGRLTVEAHVEDAEAPGACVVVRDTGVGIAPERLETIFLPRETTTPGGKGLGLTIVRQFVLDHGGQIHCESVPGEGAAFFVWLPRRA